MSDIAAGSAPFVNRPIRAAIIDLDGTMVDAADDFVTALNAMLARVGIDRPVTREEVVDYVGKGSENLIRAACWPCACRAYHIPRRSLNSTMRSPSIKANTRKSTASFRCSIPTCGKDWKRCASSALRWPT